MNMFFNICFSFIFVLLFSTAALSLDTTYRNRANVYLGPYFASGGSLDTGFLIGFEEDFALTENIYVGVGLDLLYISSPDYRLYRSGSYEVTDEFNTLFINFVGGFQYPINEKINAYAAAKLGLAVLDDNDAANSSDSDDFAGSLEIGGRYILSEQLDFGVYARYSLVGDFDYLPSALDLSGFSIGVAGGFSF
ncbi:MAG: porin family protein [Deferribacteraceae bacterium]|jgi:hypothetical protein|nr:porin family protein [Deferribacteraceae bacterium]